MKKIRLIALTSILYFFVYTIQIVVLHRFVNPVITPLMIMRVGEGILGGDNSLVIHKTWKPIEEISPNMVYAVIAAEDQKFSTHNGFDWAAIEEAMKFNKEHEGKKMKGASTISQQTAKNVFLFPSRIWVRKVAETYFTVLIELLWSKKRIMEVYLNIVELGNGIYGVEAASQIYFKTSAAKLSKRQAATFAAIIPLPLKRSPLNPNKRTVKRRTRVLTEMEIIEKPSWVRKSK